MKFIDIHTHKKEKDTNSTSVKSFEYTSNIDVSSPFTIGAHPWMLHNFNENNFFSTIIKYKSDPNFMGVGEIGLDRLKGPAIEEQVKILDSIHEFIVKEKIKTILYHCVRAYNDLYPILKSLPKGSNLILHDYNGNHEETSNFLNLNVYFSFGANFLKENSKANTSFLLIPKERIFFESDELPSIEPVYNKAEFLAKTSFIDICQHNFKRLMEN